MPTFDDLPQPEKPLLLKSHELALRIHQEILSSQDRIPFARFMEHALYHPSLGYYNANRFTIGKQGDFTTASEISPLYAQCFARQCAQIFEQLGEGCILELGAGTGKFAGDLLLELKKLGCAPRHYYIYEISSSLKQKQKSHIERSAPELLDQIKWLDELPTHFIGVMIANEVLDALPVHTFAIHANTLQERFVTSTKQTFSWMIDTPSPLLQIEVEKIQMSCDLPCEYESEINLNLIQFIKNITQSMARGVILFADYGYGLQEYYHPERNHGTLTCFYQHHKHDQPFLFPGLQDITAHVNFTQVIDVAVDQGCDLLGFTSQAAFLVACGLLEIATLSEKELNTVDAFNLHQAIKVLTLPTEMGERIKVMGLSKNINITQLKGFSLQDKSREL